MEFDQFLTKCFTTSTGDKFPPLSPNARFLLKAGYDILLQTSERVYSSLYLVRALVSVHALLISPANSAQFGQSGFRVIPWLIRRGINFEQVEQRACLKKVYTLSHTDINNNQTIDFSIGMKRVLDILFQICASPVFDPESLERFHSGLVTSEFIVAASLLEGTNIMSEILLRLANESDNKPTTKTNKTVVQLSAEQLLSDINVQPTEILLQLSRNEFNSLLLTTKLSSATSQNKPDNIPQLVPWYPNKTRDLDLNNLKRRFVDAVPGNFSNWLVYPVLLIGENPGRAESHINSLLTFQNLKTNENLGRDTFLCLMGEYKNFELFLNNSYVPLIQASLDMCSVSRSVSVIHFPIHDFETKAEHLLVSLVLELKRRILRGEKIYMHCRGGHGRTGLVAIPLVSALFDISFEDSYEWVQESYKASKRGQMWRWRLPETEEQINMAKKITERVRLRTLEEGN